MAQNLGHAPVGEINYPVAIFIHFRPIKFHFQGFIGDKYSGWENEKEPGMGWKQHNRLYADQHFFCCLTLNN